MALREELIGRRHVSGSRADTEVVLHLYEEEGTQCLDKLNGMFAFGIWDKRKKTIFLARDRLGVKPLAWIPMLVNLLNTTGPQPMRKRILFPFNQGT